MKKFISGVIVGALLFSGVTVFADSASLIGQKVQGLFTIEKNGKKVDDAIIINGTAYAPVRSVAEASGAKLTVEGKKIIMEDATTPTEKRSAELEAELDKTTAEIERITAGIKDLETNVIPPYEAMAKRWQLTEISENAHKQARTNIRNSLNSAKLSLSSLKRNWLRSKRSSANSIRKITKSLVLRT